jgi:hypothetical protein
MGESAKEEEARDTCDGVVRVRVIGRAGESTGK